MKLSLSNPKNALIFVFILICLFLLVPSVTANNQDMPVMINREDISKYIEGLDNAQLHKVNKNQETLSRLFEATLDGGSARIIVGFPITPVPESYGEGEDYDAELKKRVAEGQEQVLQSLTLESISVGNIKQYSNFPFMALTVNQAGLQSLLENDFVTIIEEDKVYHADLQDSVGIIDADDTWAEGYDGAGQVVVILDTGVDKTHEMLTGKVVSEACYSTTDSNYHSTSICKNAVQQSTEVNSAMPYIGNCPDGKCDHGTHVAGIAAGAGGTYSGSVINGVAKGSDIIAIQVFSSFNDSEACVPYDAPCVMTWTSDQISAMDRIYDLNASYNIASVNMSFGGGYYSNESTCDSINSSMKAIVDVLASQGIVTVASSGNEGYTSGMEAPACISSIISVGATIKYADPALAVASYSNSASFLDIVAPGTSIISAIPGGGYDEKTGTSMAAPHVAGAIAVIKESKPDATSQELKDAILDIVNYAQDPKNGLVSTSLDVFKSYELLNLCSVQTDIPESECNALVDFYWALNGENWTINQYWLKVPNICGDWWGVDCENGHVTEIDLHYKNLDGGIPESIGDLPYLEVLDLNNNLNLDGPFPDALWTLSNLETLDLGATVVNDQVPPEVANLTNLVHLSLESPVFTDPYPAEIGSLSNLQYLRLQGSWTGSIPAVYGNLSNLQHLEIWNGSMTDALPSELGNLSNLEELIIRYSHISTEIPSFIESLSNLRVIDLNSNLFTGSIPAGWGSLSILETINLGNNQLTGTIPSEIGNLTNLTSLILEDNNLTGRMPENFLGLPLVDFLAPENVCLPHSTELDSWYATISNLVYFHDCPGKVTLISPVDFTSDRDPLFIWTQDLGADEYYLYIEDSDQTEIYSNWVADGTFCDDGLCQKSTGVLLEDGTYTWNILPRSSIGEGQVSETSTFDVDVFSSCAEQSSIPEAECDALVDLFDTTNVPGWYNYENWKKDPDPCNWYGIGCEANAVTSIELSNNRLAGPFPVSITNLSSLEILDLSHAGLTGSIPAEIGNLSSLVEMDLFNTQISGSIPPEIGNLSALEYFAISSVYLSGSLPTELGNLSNLKHLQIENGHYTGSMPESISNLNQLETLIISVYGITGSLPSGLSNITTLQTLVLTKLGITDPLPASISNLTNLTHLDFSESSFTGKIPDEFTALVNLEYLRFNGRTCKDEGDALKDAWYASIDEVIYYSVCPGKVALISPKSPKSISDPWFYWAPDAGSYEYNLVISGPEDTVVDIWLRDLTYCDDDECTYNPNIDFTQDVEYTWKILTRNSVGVVGEWSNTATFKFAYFESCASSPFLPQSECEALVSIFTKLFGEIGEYADINPCKWDGPSCSDGHVTLLTFFNKGISVEIPPEIAGLTYLKYLFLNINSFTGSIPEELAQMPNLLVIRLQNNYGLGGRIPDSFINFQSLIELRLEGTNVCEPQDPAMQDWLVHVGLYAPSGIDCALNKVTLNSPSGSITTLDPEYTWTQDDPADEYRLYVEGSGGVVYDSWLAEGDVCTSGTCTFSTGVGLASDTYIWKVQTRSSTETGPWSDELSFSTFTCSDQSSIPEAECSALVAFYNSTDGDNWTDKTGWLVDADPCDWFGISCHEGYVHQINMPNNGLVGEIPSNIGDFSNLYALMLWLNPGMVGTIPVEIGDLTNLEYFDLSGNNHTGSIPSELGNLPILRYLYLADNGFSGPIPANLGNLSELIELYLQGNQLSGQVPNEFGGLGELVNFNISGNLFTGAIPDELVNLSILEGFNYSSTNTCTPQDPAFQTWLSGITTVIDSGIDCPYIATLQSPSGKIFDTIPTFTWDEDSGAEEYRFYLNDAGGNLVNTWLAEGDVCSEGTCTYSLGYDLELGAYNWAIQTRSPIEAGPWTDFMQFSVSNPEPLSPTGRINDVRPEYTWEEWSGADDYRLFVSHAAVGTVVNEWYEASAVCSEGTCAAISDVHLQTGNHSFTFQARNDAGTINDWSTYLGFNLLNDSPPDEAIIPISPTGGEQTTINPAYSWNEVDRASWYKVFIGSQETGKVYNAYHRAAEVCYGTLCQITPAEYLLSGSPVSSLEYGIAHQWFVMPVNVMGNGTWSDAQQFETEPEP